MEQINNFDFVKEQDGHFHILKNNKAFRAEVVNADFSKNTFTIKINGNSAIIEFAYGLSSNKLEKMGLIKRNDLWYLSSL